MKISVTIAGRPNTGSQPGIHTKALTDSQRQVTKALTNSQSPVTKDLSDTQRQNIHIHDTVNQIPDSTPKNQIKPEIQDKVLQNTKQNQKKQKHKI